jgi:hypothetical protein
MVFGYRVELDGEALDDLAIVGPGMPDRDQAGRQTEPPFRGYYRLRWHSSYPGDKPPPVTIDRIDVHDFVKSIWYRDVTMEQPLRFDASDCGDGWDSPEYRPR